MARDRRARRHRARRRARRRRASARTDACAARSTACRCSRRRSTTWTDLPTTGSSAEWARLFPEPCARDALEVTRMRAAGAIVLGKTAADDFAYHGNGTSSHTGQVLNPHDPTGTTHAGRLERGLGGRRRRRDGVRRARHRRRRIESHSGAVHRRRRDEADVRARAAHRRDSDVAVSRHARAARAHASPTRRCCSPRSPARTRRIRSRSLAHGTARRSRRCATTLCPA